MLFPVSYIPIQHPSLGRREATLYHPAAVSSPSQGSFPGSPASSWPCTPRSSHPSPLLLGCSQGARRSVLLLCSFTSECATLSICRLVLVLTPSAGFNSPVKEHKRKTIKQLSHGHMAVQQLGLGTVRGSWDPKQAQDLLCMVGISVICNLLVPFVLPDNSLSVAF